MKSSIDPLRAVRPWAVAPVDSTLATHALVSYLLLDFPRLTRALSCPGVVSAVVTAMSALAPRTRVALSIYGHVSTQPLASSSAGSIFPGDPAAVFYRPLEVRGIDYGQISIELLDEVEGRELVFAALETLALQLALYAERLYLKGVQLALREEHAGLETLLRTEKTVSRAAGLLAQSRGISLLAADEWIRAEAERRERSALSLAEMVIATLLPAADTFPRPFRQPGRPRGVAA